MTIFERGEMSVPNAMIELPHNYSFSYPSTWRSGQRISILYSWHVQSPEPS